MAKENVFVVVSPARDDHPALDRAIINAKIREAGDESKLIVYVAVDPDVQSTKADNPKMYARGSWFNNIIDRLEEGGIEYEMLLSWSTEWRKAILWAAKESGADLMMGSLYDDWSAKQSVFSNDYWEILRTIDIPVMAVRPGKQPQRRVILAAVKEQDDNYYGLSKQVYERAKWASEVYGAELHVVNAYEDSLHFPDRSKMLKLTEGLSNEHIHVKQGDPVDVISKVANDIGADTIIIGTKRRTGLKRAFKGNTIEKLIGATTQDIMTQVEKE
jgi:universal stress protein E